MKGQFFIIASVIIVFTLAGLITHVYDFRNIQMTQVGEMRELDYISYIKDTLNETAHSSYSSRDCAKLDQDLISTIDILEDKLAKNGITLDIQHLSSCIGFPNPNIDFSFTITTSDLYSSTDFTVVVS